MNRSVKEPLVGGRNTPAGSQYRRGRSLTAMSRDTDENLDLFSKNRWSLSVVSSDESDVSMKLGRLSAGSAKLAKSELDDFLSSTDEGKHDYDWLLTPPGTPLFSSSDGSEPHQLLGAPRNSSLGRTVSTTKASRLSVTQSESNHSSRPIRSSSVTRPIVSASQYNTYSSNKCSSILNTSSASVSSYIRPSSPISRPPSTGRPSTPSARPTQSRSTTPSRTRPTPTSSSTEKTRPSQSSRPSTPTSRPQISANLSSPAARSNSRPTTPTSRPQVPANLSSSAARSNSRPTTPTSRPQIPANMSSSAVRSNSRPTTPTSRPQIPANLSSPAARSNSRPTTPTRRIPTPSSSPAAVVSAGRVSSNGHTPAPGSRPSSPGPRMRPQSQPAVLPDFPLDTPPNLRTTLPERPLSAGRSRPGLAVTVKGNIETPSSGNLSRRQPSPIITRGRLTEPSGRGHGHTNGYAVDIPESRRPPPVSELATRKPVKTSSVAPESTGFGRSISKKSLDMAIRHMDIRNGTGGIRPVSGTTLFPQSIRSAAPKTPSVRAPSSVNTNGSLPIYSNGVISENGNYISRSPENGIDEKNGTLSAQLSEIDIYESSRYDAILLKEDLKNTNWLHSVDDKADQGFIFDNGFELLPEPFSPL